MKTIIAIVVILLSILGSYLVAKIMVKTKKGFGKNLILEKDSKETLEEMQKIAWEIYSSKNLEEANVIIKTIEKFETDVAFSKGKIIEVTIKSKCSEVIITREKTIEVKEYGCTEKEAVDAIWRYNFVSVLIFELFVLLYLQLNGFI